jgi:hexosaminidase
MFAFAFRILKLLLFALLINTEIWAQNQVFERYPIIPAPVTLIAKEGSFNINRNTKIIIDNNSELKAATDFFIDMVNKSCGYKLTYGSAGCKKNTISFSGDLTIHNDEGYKLYIQPDNVIIRYRTSRGAFWGIQTLRQLMSASIEVKNSGLKIINVPAVEIEDSPRFVFRGFMLDVSRHFFNIDFLKKCIDVMAFYKLNSFHLHLTDDQGWRIEIKKYPLLQSISAWRKETLIGHRLDTPKRYDGIRYGGYYTQKQLKDLVQYAHRRFITIIPEIDLPGHSQAVLAAYPEFGCIDSTYQVARGWGVHKDILCPKEETFSFLRDVFAEVMAIFPGQYIHIGGDEVPEVRWKESAFCQTLIKKLGLKDEHELQSYFVQRIQNFVNSRGRTIIGWDEILNGDITPNTVIMSWHGEKGGIAAAKQKIYSIMVPVLYTYVNLYQTKDRKHEPLSNGGFLPLRKVYSYDPLPSQLTPNEAKYILGTEACLWTEYVGSSQVAETMAFPRLCALAEVGWTPLAQKDYEAFTKRLDQNITHLEKMGVHFFKYYRNYE